MAVHAYNPSTGEAEAGGLLQAKASLVYIVNSRPVRALQGDFASEIQQTKEYRRTWPAC